MDNQASSVRLAESHSGYGELESGITDQSESNLAAAMRCYCDFVCEGADELKVHIIRVHGARNGDWRTWVAG